MAARKQSRKDQPRGLSEQLWNIIGGAMVSAMLAGVVYVLVGSINGFLKGDGSFWELTYLKWYFGVILVVYMLMPTLLANLIGFLFGSKSKASGKKPTSTSIS